jgi:hypothetical protein
VHHAVAEAAFIEQSELGADTDREALFATSHHGEASAPTRRQAATSPQT